MERGARAAAEADQSFWLGCRSVGTGDCALSSSEALDADVCPLFEQLREIGLVRDARGPLDAARIPGLAAVEHPAKQSAARGVAHLEHQRRFARLRRIGPRPAGRHRVGGVDVEIDHTGEQPQHVFAGCRHDLDASLLERLLENLLDAITRGRGDLLGVLLGHILRNARRRVVDVAQPVLLEGDLGRVQHDLGIRAEVCAWRHIGGVHPLRLYLDQTVPVVGHLVLGRRGA